MIIDKKSIEKYGNIPKVFERIVENVSRHAKKFSQGYESTFVYYVENINEYNDSGWVICDNHDRGIFKPIFLSAKNNKFYVIRDYKLHVYKDQRVGPIKHSEQFFFKDIDLLYI
tara:strand:+ start:139 stop:480 length:342 start_codon:yes stop_codon:yes gene_type:complete